MDNPNQPKIIPLTINLLTYNSSHDLGPFFESLKIQTNQNFILQVIDNASSDDSVTQSAKLWPSAVIQVNKTNLGYTGGHNVGLNMVNTEYVLIANPDVALSDTFIETLLATISSDPKLGSAGGKLIRLSNDLKHRDECVIIDSVGLAVNRGRRFIDRGQGEVDHGQFDFDSYVFGLSGALVMYRMAALKRARLPNGQYFDERYFMYREDIDLAWRLQHFGWLARYKPKALAWHRRTAIGNATSNDSETASNRRHKSAQVNYWSYRNHLFTLAKNERATDFWRDGLWIIWYEFKKLIYLIVFERQSLRALNNLFNQRNQIRADRRSIQSQGLCNMSEWTK